MTEASSKPLFSAGGHSFTWVDVIDAARLRGDWATVQRRLTRLLARERELAASDALPEAAAVRSSANEFRYSHQLLSSDELQDWLKRQDVRVDEWMGEMLRTRLEPADHEATIAGDELERATRVHARCSGDMSTWALRLAEDVALALTAAGAVSLDDLASAPERRQRFADSQTHNAAVAAEIASNAIEWTRIDLHSLRHPDEMVVREVVMCINLDGRSLAEVAAAAGTPVSVSSVLVEDADARLRPRLLAAQTGDLIGPLRVDDEYEVILLVARVPPTADDAGLRRRATDSIVKRAIEAEVNRHVRWHGPV